MGLGFVKLETPEDWRKYWDASTVNLYEEVDDEKTEIHIIYFDNGDWDWKRVPRVPR